MRHLPPMVPFILFKVLMNSNVFKTIKKPPSVLHCILHQKNHSTLSALPILFFIRYLTNYSKDSQFLKKRGEEKKGFILSIFKLLSTRKNGIYIL